MFAPASPDEAPRLLPMRSTIVGLTRCSTISPVVGALQIGGVGIATPSPSIYIQMRANGNFSLRAEVFIGHGVGALGAG